MSRRLTIVLAAFLGVLVIAGVVLATTRGNDETADEVLAQTFGDSKSVKSGRLEAGLSVDAKGLANLEGPVDLRLSGPFSSTKSGELPRFDFEVAIDASGQRLTAGAVSTGKKGFLRFQGQAYEVPDELYAVYQKGYAEQAKCNEDRDSGVSFKTLGVDPRNWLRDAKKSGDTEKVGGAETIHVTAGVDVTRFVDDLNRILARTESQPSDPCAEDEPAAKPKQGSRQLTDAQRKQIVDAVTSARVDVWTGEDDKALRRINVDLGLDGGGKVKFDLLIGALNEDQKIEAPTDTKPLNDLLAQMGGAQQGTQPQQDGASGSQYDQCVAEAGADVRKLQECADLIGS
jgi:hypothetical protein